MDKKCKLCQRNFREKEIKYEVLLDVFSSCDICKPIKKKFDGKSILIYRISERVYYRKEKAMLCETCVEAASVEEVLSFGKKIKRSDYTVLSEGKGYDIEEVSVVKGIDYEEDNGEDDAY